MKYIVVMEDYWSMENALLDISDVGKLLEALKWKEEYDKKGIIAITYSLKGLDIRYGYVNDLEDVEIEKLNKASYIKTEHEHEMIEINGWLEVRKDGAWITDTMNRESMYLNSLWDEIKKEAKC